MEPLSAPDRALLDELRSHTPLAIDHAIHQIEEHGKVALVPALLQIYNDSTDSDTIQKLQQLLIGLKAQQAIHPIMAAIANADFAASKQFLVSLAWQTSLDFGEYTNDFVNLLILENDFMVAFEAFTVLENLESGFRSDELEIYIRKLKNASLHATPEKQQLMHDLVRLWQDMEQ